jgi:hypothetical protein
MAQGEAADWAARGRGTDAWASSAGPLPGEWRGTSVFNWGRIVVLAFGAVRLIHTTVSSLSASSYAGAALVLALGVPLAGHPFLWRVVADTEGVRYRSWFVTRHRAWDDIVEVRRVRCRRIRLVCRDGVSTLRIRPPHRDLADSLAPALTAMLRNPTLRPPVSSSA